MDKRDKPTHELIDDAEKLSSLGHPRHWAREQRQKVYREHQRFGRTELDIKGIRGVGKSVGYLGYLEKQLVRFTSREYPGSSLITAEENALVRLADIAETKAEIIKYREALAKLERSAEAVAAYLSDCRSALRTELARLCFYRAPNQHIAQDSRRAVLRGAEARLKEIEALKRDIGRYTRLMEDLQPN